MAIRFTIWLSLACVLTFGRVASAAVGYGGGVVVPGAVTAQGIAQAGGVTKYNYTNVFINYGYINTNLIWFGTNSAAQEGKYGGLYTNINPNCWGLSNGAPPFFLTNDIGNADSGTWEIEQTNGTPTGVFLSSGGSDFNAALGVYADYNNGNIIVANAVSSTNPVVQPTSQAIFDTGYIYDQFFGTRTFLGYPTNGLTLGQDSGPILTLKITNAPTPLFTFGIASSGGPQLAMWGGTVQGAYGNLGGFHVINTNLYTANPGGDNRTFIFRPKDPNGTTNGLNMGGYNLWESRFFIGAPDQDGGYANFLNVDTNGNVGLGHNTLISDQVNNVHKTNPAKVTVWAGSHTNFPPFAITDNNQTNLLMVLSDSNGNFTITPGTLTSLTNGQYSLSKYNGTLTLSNINGVGITNTWIPTNFAKPTPPTATAGFWSSNGWLYYITAQHPNGVLITAP